MDGRFERLGAIVSRHVTAGYRNTAVPHVAIGFADSPTRPRIGVCVPALCLVVQGAKEITIGEKSLRYAAGDYFVASIGLPAVGHISEASSTRPFLAISLTIDRTDLADVVADAPSPVPNRATTAFAVDRVGARQLDGFERLLNLMDAPDDIAVLAPLYYRELLYRLLQGERSGLLRQLAVADSGLTRIHRAILWIRDHYSEPLRIEALAAISGMSKATFHRHFKDATAMSPLQFQKRLRLQEARRVLFHDGRAQAAAYAVGYESASQFSREYTRLFGISPIRDAERLRVDRKEWFELPTAISE